MKTTLFPYKDIRWVTHLPQPTYISYTSSFGNQLFPLSIFVNRQRGHIRHRQELLQFWVNSILEKIALQNDHHSFNSATGFSIGSTSTGLLHTTLIFNMVTFFFSLFDSNAILRSNWLLQTRYLRHL